MTSTNLISIPPRALQIGIQEYSAVTKWRNPAASFVLPDVHCAECHECIDVDLCATPPDDEPAATRHWHCANCGAQYGSEQVESRLVEIVERKCLRYQLQDLRCAKTQRVAVRAMARTSDCSAPLKLDIGRDAFLREMTIMSNLASYYDLEYLKEITSSFLGH